MIKRIVEVSTPAILTVKNRQLVICREDEPPAIVPIDDLGILIFDNPAITCSVGLMDVCFENNVVMVSCDRKHLPNALFLPMFGNTLHTKTLATQIQITRPTKKRLWKSIIKTKITEQAKVIRTIGGDGVPLQALAAKVRTGDSANTESQAARIYWRKLFGPDFQRDRNALGINAMLNYGYAAVRASVARAIVGAGLHPALGLHHHNQYDNFCLADDLMEPLRPPVDLIVHQLSERSDIVCPLTPSIKKALLEILAGDFSIKGAKLPLFAALHRYAASLRRVACGESKDLEIPSYEFRRISEHVDTDDVRPAYGHERSACCLSGVSGKFT